jgi:surface polysaccharide O-acyltransferase-like enzyme
MGWMIQKMKGHIQVSVTTVIGMLLLISLNEASLPQEAVQFLAIAFLLLAFGARLMMHPRIARGLQVIASTTLLVYLLHQFVVTVIRYKIATTFPDYLTVLLCVPISFGLGFIAKVCFDTGTQKMSKFCGG